MLIAITAAMLTLLTPDDLLGPEDTIRGHAGACGVVEEAAGCRTITIWPHPAHPQICRCPWDLISG